jgi:hypothetical protein
MIAIFDIVESGIDMPMLRDVHDLHDLLRVFFDSHQLNSGSGFAAPP